MTITEKKDYIILSDNKTQKITTKSYSGLEPARDLDEKEKERFQNQLDKKFLGDLQLRFFMTDFYTKYGLSDQRFKGGLVAIAKGKRKDDDTCDFDILIKTKNKKDVSQFFDRIIQFLKDNEDQFKQFLKDNKISIEEFIEQIPVYIDNDSNSCNIKIGLLDVTCSVNDFASGSRTDKEAEEIYADIENETKDPCLIFPSTYESHEEFVEKKRSIRSGTTLEKLDKLKGPLLPFFFNMFTHRIVETDEFINNLYKKYFYLCKNDNGLEIKRQINNYINNHVSDKNKGSRLALLLNMALCLYRNYGVNVEWKESYLYCEILWSNVIHPEIEVILKEEKGTLSQKEEWLYQFIMNLIEPIEDFTESLGTLKDLYRNIGSSLHLFYQDPSLYQLSKIDPNFIQIWPDENGINITTPTGEEKHSDYEYPFSLSSVITFQKIDIDISYIRKELFSSSWFTGFKSLLSEEERGEFSRLFKIIKEEKTSFKAAEIFKQLAKSLNMKNNPFHMVVQSEEIPVKDFLKQWHRILVIWKNDLSSDEEYIEWLNGTARLISIVKLLNADNEQMDQWMKLYCTVLTQLLGNNEKDEKLLESFVLPFLTTQQMVCCLIATLDAKNSSLGPLLFLLLPYLASPLQDLEDQEKKLLIASIKQLLPPLIRTLNDESVKDLDLLMQMIQMADVQKYHSSKIKKEKPVKTFTLLDFQKQLKEEIEIKTVINFIKILQKNTNVSDLEELKKLKCLINFYINSYFLDDKNALACWTDLFHYFLDQNLAVEAYDRLEEIFLVGDLNQNELVSLCLTFLEKTEPSLHQWAIAKKALYSLIQQKKLDSAAFKILLGHWKNISIYLGTTQEYLHESVDLFEQMIQFFRSCVEKQSDDLLELVDWMMKNASFVKAIAREAKLNKLLKAEEVKSVTQISSTTYSEFLQVFSEKRGQEELSKTINTHIGEIKNSLLLGLLLHLTTDEFSGIKEKGLFKKMIALEIAEYIKQNISQADVGTHSAFLFNLALAVYQYDRRKGGSEEEILFFKSLWEEEFYPQLEGILKKKQTIESQKERLIYQFIKEIAKELTKSVETIYDLYQNISTSLHLYSNGSLSDQLLNQHVAIIQIDPNKIPTALTLKNQEIGESDLKTTSLVIVVKKIVDIQKDIFSSSWFVGFKSPLNKEDKSRLSKLFKASNRKKIKSKEIFEQLPTYLSLKKTPIDKCVISSDGSIEAFLQHWDHIFTYWKGESVKEWLHGMSRILSVAALLDETHPFREKWLSLYWDTFLTILLEGKEDSSVLFETYSIPFLSTQQMICCMIGRLKPTDQTIHQTLTLLLPQLETTLQSLTGEEKKSLISSLTNLLAPFTQQADATSSLDLKHLIQLIQIIHSKKNQLSEEQLSDMRKELSQSKLIGFLNTMRKGMSSENDKELKNLNILTQFYLNLYSLDEEEALKCWLDFFYDCLTAKLPKEALNRLKEIFLYANLKKEEQLTLCLHFLKQTLPSIDQWEVIEKAAQILLSQDKVNGTEWALLLNYWNKFETLCETKHQSNQNDLVEQVISFCALHIDEEPDLAIPAFEWLIHRLSFIQRLLQTKKSEEISSGEQAAIKMIAVLKKGMKKTEEMESPLFKKIASFLFSFAKTAQFFKLSEECRKAISSLHHDLLTHYLSKGRTFDDWVSLVTLREQWTFLEDIEGQNQLNCTFIHKFFNLEFKDISSESGLEAMLMKNLEIFKGFSPENRPKDFGELLIKAIHLAVEKQCLFAAVSYSLFMWEAGLIEQKEASTFLKPLIDILIKEKYFPKKTLIPLLSLMEKVYECLSIEDRLTVSESLLSSNHSHQFCLDLIIKYEMADPDLLKIVFNKITVNHVSFVNSILPIVNKKIVQDSLAVKKYLFLLEKMTINHKNSKNGIEFIKKAIAAISDFDVEESCFLAKSIYKLNLTNLNVSLRGITSLLIKNGKQSEKSIIKKFFNSLEEKDKQDLASDYTEVLLSQTPDSGDFQWISETYITCLKNTQIHAITHLYIKEEKFQLATTLVALFMKKFPSISEDDCQLFFELHMEMLLLNPQVSLCWQAAGNSIGYILSSMQSYSEKKLENTISLIDQVMEIKNLKMLVSENRASDFFTFILPAVLNSNANIEDYRDKIEEKVRGYYFDYLSLLMKEKLEYQIVLLNTLINTALKFVNEKEKAHAITERAHEFLASLLFETFVNHLDKSESYKQSALLVLCRLNIICYISQKSQSYRALNYWLTLTEGIDRMLPEYIETHIAFLDLLCYRLTGSELLDPIVRMKNLLDDKVGNNKEHQNLVDKHLKFKFYLCCGLTKIKNINDVPKALKLLVTLLNESFDLAKDVDNLSEYFKRTNCLIQFAINLNIELKIGDNNYHEMKKIMLEKNFNAKESSSEEIFKIASKAENSEIDKIFHPINSFVITYKNQLNTYGKEEDVKQFGLHLLEACIRQQCYVSTKETLIKDNNTQQESKSQSTLSLLSTYIAIGRQRLFVRGDKASDVLEWIKKCQHKKEDVSGCDRAIILHNAQLLIQESFVSSCTEHRKFAHALLEFVEELFALSEEEAMTMLSEVIISALSNPEVFDFTLFKDILSLINQYVLDDESKTVFKKPVFFNKKIMNATLTLRQIEGAEEKNPIWIPCMNYIQDLLYHRSIPLVNVRDQGFHDRTILRWAKYFKLRIERRKKQKEKEILIPLDISKAYDEMVVSLLKYVINTIMKSSSDEKYAEKIKKYAEETSWQAFEFFKDFNYLNNLDIIKEKLKELLS